MTQKKIHQEYCACPESEDGHADNCPLAHPIIEITRYTDVFENGQWRRDECLDGQETEVYIEGYGPWGIAEADVVPGFVAIGVWPTWEPWCTQEWIIRAHETVGYWVDDNPRQLDDCSRCPTERGAVMASLS